MLLSDHHFRTARRTAGTGTLLLGGDNGTHTCASGSGGVTSTWSPIDEGVLLRHYVHQQGSYQKQQFLNNKHKKMNDHTDTGTAIKRRTRGDALLVSTTDHDDNTDKQQNISPIMNEKIENSNTIDMDVDWDELTRNTSTRSLSDIQTKWYSWWPRPDNCDCPLFTKEDVILMRVFVSHIIQQRTHISDIGDGSNSGNNNRGNNSGNSDIGSAANAIKTSCHITTNHSLQSANMWIISGRGIELAQTWKGRLQDENRGVDEYTTETKYDGG
jgi:hypothetical protein